MTENDTKAIAESLLVDSVTCILRKGPDVLTSTSRGIKPLMEWIASGIDLRGYSMADLVVGKAAAMLAVLSGIVSVYGRVMSESAIAFLESHGTPFCYDKKCQYIINREKTGMCPMEETVLSIEDPKQGYQALKAKLVSLSRK